MYENYSPHVIDFFEKKGIKIGDRISVENEQHYEGILLPKSAGDPDILIIKMDNGYNIGVMFNNSVKKLKEEKGLAKKAAAPKLRYDPSKPNVTILATGGTVTSRIDYKTGGVIPTLLPEDLVVAIPEMEALANLRTALVFQMLSENIEPEHWTVLAERIAEEIDRGVDGIIVTHGTDTMVYSAAILSFMLQDLPVPVIMVGAQRSPDRGSSDAAMNLICAANFIVNSEFSGVGVCMHGTMNDDYCLIHNATNVKKMHTSRRDTFRSVDVMPWARVSYKGGIEFLNADYKKKDKNRKLVLRNKFNKKIALLKIRPGFSYKELEFYSDYDGIVLEGTGLGNAPIEVLDEYTQEHRDLLKTMEKLTKKGLIILMTSQCPYGRVNMNVYSAGRYLQQAGVIPVEMTPEAAFVKLGWALGISKNREEALKIIKTDFVGEMLSRSDPDAFLL